MKNIVVVNSVAGISSKELAEFLTEPGMGTAITNKPNKTGNFDFRGYDLVFNYGYGGDVYYKKIINIPQAVRICIHKPSTFNCFKAAGVDTVEYCTHREAIPKKWAWVVVRDEIDGRKAEGLAYYENLPSKVPVGALYSEYFEHEHEYRVVVFMGQLVGVYRKDEEAGIWTFNIQPKRGFEKMANQCIAAAKAIGIDYVGFDVVAQTKNTFKILEANSAPVLTKEAMEMIYAHIYKD